MSSIYGNNISFNINIYNNNDISDNTVFFSFRKF